ncbi:MAG: EamA family transporter [Hyphomicrobiales bacterium]|nr:EamA family transporter [Hyphomicrobiales bacterium]
MSPRHIALAALLVCLWGLNFVCTRLALDHIPPMLLVGLRYVGGAGLCVALPRPAIAWWRLLAITVSMFIGQYLCLYLALDLGFPAGLSSVALQVQAFFTIILAALMLHERPKTRQWLGTLIAMAGVGLIALSTTRAGIPVAAVILLLGAAVAWALGNIWMRGAGTYDPLGMIAWMSLLAMAPMLAVSAIFEGPARDLRALGSITWLVFGEILYIAIVSTLGGFTIWSYLVKRYPASTVAPITLAVPVTGAASAALLLGETFGLYRLAGMALILLGLVLAAMPWRLGARRRPAAAAPLDEALASKEA